MCKADMRVFKIGMLAGGSRVLVIFTLNTMEIFISQLITGQMVNVIDIRENMNKNSSWPASLQHSLSY